MRYTIAYLTARGAQLPTGEEARLETVTISGADRKIVDFAAGVDYQAIWTIPSWPGHLDSIYWELQYYATNSDTTSVDWSVEVEAYSSTDASLNFSESFDSPNSFGVTPLGSAGSLHTYSASLTSIDSVSTGDHVRIRVIRNTDSNDDDMKVLGVTLFFNGPDPLPGGTGTDILRWDTVDSWDSSYSAGNTRGTNAADLQTYRDDDSQVASGICSAVGGGAFNTVSSDYSNVGGGSRNAVSGGYSNIGGGSGNSISSCILAFVGGGNGNTVSSSNGTIAGGQNNAVSADYGCIVGGSYNNVTGQYAGVVAGNGNQVNASYGFVGGGASNIISGTYSAVLGGSDCSVTANFGAVGGGMSNDIFANYGVIGGGSGNVVSGEYGAILGGASNNAANSHTCVVGGGNTAGAVRSIATGYLSSSYMQCGKTFAAGAFAEAGDAQVTNIVIRQTTSNDTPTELFVDTSFSTRVQLRGDCAYHVTVDVVATTEAQSDSAAYVLKALVKTPSGTASIVGSQSKTVLAESESTWDCNITIDSGEMKIMATGESAVAIRWVAHVTLVEAKYSA